MNIRLEIGEIVLHGFDVTNVAGLDRIIEIELAKMLSRSTVMQGRTAMKTIEQKTVDERYHSQSLRTTQGRRGGLQLLGTSIAKSVYNNLERRAKQR